MFFNLNGSDLGIDMIPYPVAPNKGNHDQQHQFFQSIQGNHMGVLDVEATGFQSPKERFHLPPLPVIFQGLVRPVKGDQDEVLHFAILYRSGPREIAQLTVHPDNPLIMSQLTSFQVIEQMPGRDLCLPFLGRTP